MDLLQLEHFLAVAEERTFTRAAEQGYLSDSAAELIKLVRNFNWERPESVPRSAALPSLIDYAASAPRRGRTY